MLPDASASIEPPEWQGVPTEFVIGMAGTNTQPPVVPPCPEPKSCHALLTRPLETLRSTKNWPDHVCEEVARYSVRVWLNSVGTPSVYTDDEGRTRAELDAWRDLSRPLDELKDPPSWTDVFPLPVGESTWWVYESADAIHNLPRPDWTVYAPARGFVWFARRIVIEGGGIVDLFFLVMPESDNWSEPWVEIKADGVPNPVLVDLGAQAERFLQFIGNGRLPVGRPRTFESLDELKARVGAAIDELRAGGERVSQRRVAEVIFGEFYSDSVRALQKARSRYGLTWKELVRIIEGAL